MLKVTVRYLCWMNSTETDGMDMHILYTVSFFFMGKCIKTDRINKYLTYMLTCSIRTSMIWLRYCQFNWFQYAVCNMHVKWLKQCSKINLSLILTLLFSLKIYLFVYLFYFCLRYRFTMYTATQQRIIGVLIFSLISMIIMITMVFIIECSTWQLEAINCSYSLKFTYFISWTFH